MDTIEFYQDAQGEYRWRYQAEGNNETMADSGQGYVDRNECVKAAQRVTGRVLYFSDTFAAGEGNVYIKGEWK